MSAGSKPLRPWQVCAGDVIGSGKRVEYVFERYGELYINASDEELVRQGKRTYGEELTRLYDLDLSGWRVAMPSISSSTVPTSPRASGSMRGAGKAPR